MRCYPSLGYIEALVACLASLSLVASYVPLNGPVGALHAVSRRPTCPLGTPRVQASLRARRLSLGLQMVDLQPRVDINAEDFLGAKARQGSFDPLGPYDQDDGGTEVSKVFSEEYEERDPNDVRNFPISDQTMDALAKRGITKLFDIQSATFNEIYNGRDVLGRARTGTGKTLAFALPILERLIIDKTDRGAQRRARGTKPSCIILSPTRELAVQVETEIHGLTEGGDVKVATLCVYGGVSYTTQQRELKNGVDMVVGTPGRMIDLYEKGMLDLSEVKYLVLDEADEMLNKGFADDVEHLMEGMPSGTDRPQTMLFSATEPPWIKQLARKNLVNHHTVDLVGNSKVKLAEGITNVAVTATARQRSTMLADLITLYRSQHAIVFVNTKKEADSLVAELGIIMKGTEALHGDVPQSLREKILNGFRSGRIPVLIATDVAARGLDIDHVDLVVHHGVPTSVENFIHRSGRTGRAGRKGTSLVLYDKNEQWALGRIEKDAGIKFEKRGAPQPDEVMEASAFRVAANLEHVNPELEPYFMPMAEKLMADGGVAKLAQALAWMSGYKSPPSKRSLQTGEDELRTVQLKPDEKGDVQVRDVMRIVSGCLAEAGAGLSAADTRIGRIARCMDGSAVIDISEKGASFLTDSLKAYEGSKFYAAGRFILPDELPELEEEQRRSSYGGGGGGGGGYRGETGYNRRGGGGGGYRAGGDRGGGGYRGGGGGGGYSRDGGSGGYRGASGGGGYRSDGEGGYRGGGGVASGSGERTDFTVVKRADGGYRGGVGDSSGSTGGGRDRRGGGDSWGGSGAERGSYRKEERWN